MKINFLMIFLIMLCLAGCASKKDYKFIDQVPEDLARSFDLSNKNFDKFKVKEIKEIKRKEEISLSDKKKSNIKKKEILTNKNKEKNKNKLKSIKGIEKKKGVVEEDSSVKKIIQKDIDPEGYPEVYNKYDLISEKIWKDLSPNIYIGEESIMKISLLGITVGALKLSTHKVVKMGQDKVFHFSATLKSASYYSMIYKLDDIVDSFVKVKNFLPMKYSLVQRESGQNVDDLQLFDFEKRQTFFWYKRNKKGVIRKQEKNSFIPRYIQDVFSSLYFVRGLPLRVGATYTFPIVMRAKIWKMTMSVEKKEEIKIMGKWHKAVKVNAFTVLAGKNKKNGQVSFWYSDDSIKKLLSFKAKVKIGNVEGEMIEYRPGQKYNK